MILNKHVHIDDTVGAINGFGLLQAVEHYPHKGAGTTYSLYYTGILSCSPCVYSSQ